MMIFKRILLVTAGLFSFSVLQAQTGFIPGLQAGLCISNLSSPQFESKARMGFMGGVTFAAVMGDKLDIITEMGYLTQGGTIAVNTRDENGDLSTVKKDVELHYGSLQWAVLPNFYIIAPNLSLQGGFFVNQPIRAEASDNGEIGTDPDVFNNITTHELADRLGDAMDYGLLLGASGGIEDVRVNLRYEIGVRNFLKKESKPTEFKASTNTIMLTLNYRFSDLRVN